MFTSLGLVVWDIINPVALSALGFFGLEGFQLHRELLELVLSIKQLLSFKNCLLHCQVECKEKGVDPSGLQMQKYLLLEHIDLVNQLVHRLAASLADVFVVPKYILRTYVRKAQVIEKELLEFFPSVVMIYPYQILSVPSIMEGVLRVAFCQHHLVFYAPVRYQLRLIHMLICLGKLLQFQIRLTFVRWDF